MNPNPLEELIIMTTNSVIKELGNEETWDDVEQRIIKAMQEAIIYYPHLTGVAAGVNMLSRLRRAWVAEKVGSIEP